MLLLLLALPAFVFLILKQFGTNHFRLPYYLPLTDQEGIPRLSGRDTLYTQLDLNLLDVKADSASLHLYLVHAVRMPCADSCEKVLAQAARLYSLSSTIKGLRLISLAEKGVFDSARSERWIIKEMINEELNKKIAALRFEEKLLGGQTIPLKAKFLLLDHKGFIRGYYNALSPEDIDRAMAEIKVLEYEYKQTEN